MKEPGSLASEYRNNREIIPFVDINKRTIEYGQMVSGILEYEIYKMPDGSFDRLLGLMREVIRHRENHGERVEFWECLDFFGEFDPRIKERLLKSRGVNLDP